MAKAKNPVTFAHEFGIDEKQLNRLGVLNVTLAIDTKLFIDPLLLKSSRHTEVSGSAVRQYHQHFEQVIKLLRASRAEKDPAWKGAQKLLTFPEISGTCLGYGAGSIHGSGFGVNLSSRIISVASQIVRIGIEDPDLFVAMALFEPDFGPDRISDMTTNIIFGSLASFNSRILQSLGLKGSDYTYKNVNGVFVLNPYEEKKTPIILLPTDILNDLPIAHDWDGVADAASKNDQLRNEVNLHIASIWLKKSKRDKMVLKREVLSSERAFELLLSAMHGVPAVPYDVESDPDGLIRWASKGQHFAEQFPIKLSNTTIKTIDEVYYMVGEIITQFRQLIEHNGLNKELYREDKKPRHESTAQRLFFSVAYTYCVANNVDVSPEIDTGNGKIDFKFSTGFNERVLVEIKLSTNSNIVSGYTTQLELYKSAQQTMRAIYLVIDVGSMGKKDEKLLKIKNEAAKRGHPLSSLEFVDGSLQASPSKRKK